MALAPPVFNYTLVKGLEKKEKAHRSYSLFWCERFLRKRKIKKGLMVGCSLCRTWRNDHKVEISPPCHSHREQPRKKESKKSENVIVTVPCSVETPVISMKRGPSCPYFSGLVWVKFFQVPALGPISS